MSRLPFAIWLLLAGASRTGECRVMTGPDGLCAFVRLEPSRSDLRVGTTLRVQVNGLNCDGGLDRRVRWRSTLPDVASVDSTGLVRAERPGRADIRLESDDGAGRAIATMQVVITP